MEATEMSLAESERGQAVEETRRGEEKGEKAPTPALSHGDREREADAPGASPEPEPGPADADTHAEDTPASDELDWQERAESAEHRVAELGDRLGAVEAAAEDLRRIVGESERARRVDRELLIAGVIDLDGARALVEEQMADGATALEAVSRVKERRPLMFAGRARGVRATVMPAPEGGGARPVEDLADAARETGDRRLLLRYLRMRRGEG